MYSTSSHSCYGTGNTCPSSTVSSCTHSEDVTVECSKIYHFLLVFLSYSFKSRNTINTTCSGLLIGKLLLNLLKCADSSTSTDIIDIDVIAVLVSISVAFLALLVILITVVVLILTIRRHCNSAQNVTDNFKWF